MPYVTNMKKHLGHEDGYRYQYFDEYGGPDEYRLKDLEISSALVASGFEVVEILPKSRHEFWFVFSHTEELAEAVEAFWNHSMQLSPLLFSTTRRNLKNRLFTLKTKS